VRNDGTALPRFIYGKRGALGTEIAVDGRPFYVDMTDAGGDAFGDTYLGLDFGTSTSSFSFVKDEDIRTFQRRSKDRGWLEINELVPKLPYPIAFPLASYIGETSAEGIERLGRESFEAMLTLVAYIFYAECCAMGRVGALFKIMHQRSAGPLWHTIKQLNPLLGNDSTFTTGARGILDNDIREEIERAVNELPKGKHGKRAQDVNVNHLLTVMGNRIGKIFSRCDLGYFEKSSPETVRFRKIRGRISSHEWIRAAVRYTL
jgi:hypothetical protein